MKPELLEFLACPDCHGTLRLSAGAREGVEVIAGDLSCPACMQEWPVRGGVPRFVPEHPGRESARTVAAFGWEWRKFSEIEDRYEQQFLDWIAPVRPEEFAGCVVLEGGCGKGRHSRLVASYGARALIGVDLSDAVDVAFANTRGLPNAHIVQADLLRLPLRSGICDRAFSIGVLHHLPDPRAGFLSLVRAVRAGGTVSVWVYGAEGNWWISHIVSPVRKAITSRLPPSVLYLISMLLSVPLRLALVAIYRPARRPRLAWLRRWLFYYPYLSYISGFPFREIHHIVHDHLAAPVAYYLRRDEVEAWYRDIDALHYEITSHNENSWRGRGVVDAPVGSAMSGGAET